MSCRMNLLHSVGSLRTSEIHDLIVNAEKFRVFRTTAAWLHSTISNASDCRSRCQEFEFQPGRINFMEINHEIFSMLILGHQLILRVIVSYWQKYVN